MVGDGLSVVGEAQILQRVEQQRRVIVECRDGHLQAHGPQLAGLHLSRQTLQSCSYEQGNHLRKTDRRRDFLEQRYYKRLWIVRVRLV